MSMIIFNICLQQQSPNCWLPLTLVCQAAHSPGLDHNQLAWLYLWQILGCRVICHSGHLGPGTWRSAEHLVWECSSRTYCSQGYKGARMQLSPSKYLSGAIWPLMDSLCPWLHILLSPCCWERYPAKAAFLSPVACYYYLWKEAKWSSTRNQCGTGREDDGFPLAALGTCILLSKREGILSTGSLDCLGWEEALSLVLFWMLQLMSPRQLCYKKESRCYKKKSRCYKKESRWTTCSPGTDCSFALSFLAVCTSSWDLPISSPFWLVMVSFLQVQGAAGRDAGGMGRGRRGSRCPGPEGLDCPLVAGSPVKPRTFPRLPGYCCGGWKTRVLLFFQ